MIRAYVRSILLEGRIDDAKKKYGSGRPDGKGLPDYMVDMLAKGDPSENKKYLMWMAREAWEGILSSEEMKKKYPNRMVTGTDFKDGRYIDQIIRYVQGFHERQDRLDVKDIYQYKEAEDLRDAVDALPMSKSQTRKEAKKKGAELIYNEDDTAVFFMHTHEAVCYYGSGTKWCISDSTVYEIYQEDNTIFYIVIDKSLDASNPKHKIAVSIERAHDDNGIKEMVSWDSEDKPLRGGMPNGEAFTAIYNDAQTRPKLPGFSDELAAYLQESSPLRYVKLEWSVSEHYRRKVDFYWKLVLGAEVPDDYGEKKRKALAQKKDRNGMESYDKILSMLERVAKEVDHYGFGRYYTDTVYHGQDKVSNTAPIEAAERHRGKLCFLAHMTGTTQAYNTKPVTVEEFKEVYEKLQSLDDNVEFLEEQILKIELESLDR